MRLRLRITLCLLAVGAAVAAAPGAAAGPGATFALKPAAYDPALPLTRSYFVVAASPGSVTRHRVQIVNTGMASGSAYVYAVDGTTGQTSGAVYLDRRRPRKDVAQWVNLPPRRVTLAPGDSAFIPFTLRVPEGARPGDHLGGIVAENAHVRKASGGHALRINIRHLTVVAVAVQVPGVAGARLDLSGVSPAGEHGYQYVRLMLRNTGEKTTKPAGTLTLRDARGTVVASRAFQLDTFLPRTAIRYPVLLPGQVLAPGPYTATVRLTYGASPFGYRRASEESVTRTYRFPLTITERNREQVFSGAPAVRQPSAAPAAVSRPFLPWIVGGVSAAVALVLVVLVVIRRWHQSSS